MRRHSGGGGARSSDCQGGWVDADQSRPLVARGAIDIIRSNPEVQRIIQAYLPHGPEMVQKLWKHLDFMVDNRRKFYASRA